MLFRLEKKRYESFASAKEMFTKLKINLSYMDLDKKTKCIMITSAMPNEGKSFLSANLAGSLASEGLRVLLIDGDILINAADETVPQRRRLSWSGSVSIALALSEKGEIVSEPDVKFAGLPMRTADGRSMDDVIADAALLVLESLNKTKRRDPDAVEVAVERAVRSAVNAVWGKKPVCHVIVLVV